VSAGERLHLKHLRGWEGMRLCSTEHKRILFCSHLPQIQHLDSAAIGVDAGMAVAAFTIGTGGARTVEHLTDGLASPLGNKTVLHHRFSRVYEIEHQSETAVLRIAYRAAMTSHRAEMKGENS
jgi:hypothetical protein